MLEHYQTFGAIISTILIGMLIYDYYVEKQDEADFIKALVEEERVKSETRAKKRSTPTKKTTKKTTTRKKTTTKAPQRG